MTAVAQRPGRTSAETREAVRRFLRTGSIFIALGLLWTVLAFKSEYFLTEQNLLNILLQSSTVGILAAGVTLVLIAGEIDISVASVQALAATVAATVIITRGGSVVLGIAAGILVAVLAGAVNGYMTIYARIPSFIVTLAMLGIAQGAAFLVTSGQAIGEFPHAYSVLGQGKVGPVPVPVIIAGIVYLTLHLLLSQTPFGVNVYAVGGSRNASRLVGLRIERTIMTVFVISGALAGLSGIILSARLDAAHGSFGASDLLDAVAAVVIGGTSLFGGSGNVVGTLGGVIIIGTIRNGLVLLNVEAFWTQVVVGVVILVAVMLDQLFKGELAFRDLVPGLRRG
jgi:ribose/xylose/arabinose/galactoside ABC-type transport system permease subunit